MWALESFAFPSAFDGHKRARPIACDILPDGTLHDPTRKRKQEGGSDGDSAGSKDVRSKGFLRLDDTTEKFLSQIKAKKPRVGSRATSLGPDITAPLPKRRRRPTKRKPFEDEELDVTTAIGISFMFCSCCLRKAD